MNKFYFRIEVETHDQTGEVMAVYFQVRKGKSAKIKEYEGGNVFADYDKHGDLLGIEMLAPCKVAVLKRIAPQQPVQRFITRSIPRGMLATA